MGERSNRTDERTRIVDQDWIRAHTVDGIRPHRPMTEADLELAELAARNMPLRLQVELFGLELAGAAGEHNVVTSADDQDDPDSTWSLECSCGYEALEFEDEDAASSAADDHVGERS